MKRVIFGKFPIYLLALTLACNAAFSYDRTRSLQNNSAIVASKAYAWLVQNQARGHFGHDVVWLYDILIRKFGLPEPAAVRTFRRETHDGRYWKAPFAPILHIIAPSVSYRPDLPSASRDPIDRLVFRAMWCDRIPLEPDYLQRAELLAKAGGYELTHMYLAMVILREQKCSAGTGQDARRQELEGIFARQLEELCVRSPLVSDLQIEAAAFLAHGNPGRRLPDRFLVKVLTEAEFHFDNPFVSKMSGHTAVLLLWYLLENAVPGPQPVPLAPRR